jgi:CelD/BcsL family acetyltransferase involved in cellulose biosynthesis
VTAKLPGFRVTAQRVEHPAVIEREWRELQDQSACSFFQSWNWIGVWLEQVVNDLQPRVIRVWHDGDLVGMGMYVAQGIRRHFVVFSRAEFLNEYPANGRNMVIEYNGLLAREGYQDAVYTEVIRYLLAENSGCDEIYFGGMHDISSLIEAAGRFIDRADLITNQESVSWQVDLEALQPSLDSYLDSLSKSRRWQIRRSCRLYEQHGPLGIEAARDVDEALQYFDGLKGLHTDRWQARGEQGSFANPRWERFHRALIRSGFDRGEVQLLRVANDQGAIGYLYNFIWRSRVYVLQTGIRPPGDNRLKPAYVANAMAIVHNKKLGMSVYDFMHGDSHYKETLCNQNQKLYWMVVRRHRLKFRLEDLAVKLVRRGRALLKSQPDAGN